jgi:hypothetical protein
VARVVPRRAGLAAARPRLRAALVAGALLATAAPLMAQAMAPALTCGVKQTNRWERIPIRSFQPINGIAASQNDTVTAYTVDEYRPQDLAATNGSTIQLTHTHGCIWSKSLELSPAPSLAQPFPGVTSTIVSVALLNGTAIAAVQEGSGSASRPHILASRHGSSWTASDSGLPAQGAPRLLRASSDGRTAYLTVSPTASGGSDSGSTTGILPGLPGSGPGTGTPTGFLYRTTDGGASWTLQTGATDLPSGGTGFSQLDLDPANSDYLYGIVGGRLLSSRDGGNSFTTASGSGFTAVTAMGGGQVVAFTSSGQGLFSNTGGMSYAAFRAPMGVTSAAYRTGESSVVVESSGALRLFEPANGMTTPIPAAVPARTGTLLGDRGAQASIHALAGHALLRYVDPTPPGVTFPPIAVGDNTVPPPVPGTVTPSVRNVSLPMGSSELESFTLNLPKNPTPLDLFFLVDVTTSMGDYINSIKANIHKIVGSLTAAKVNLRVGVGILGSGPAKGEAPFPEAYVYPPTVDNSTRPPTQHPDPRHYVKPVLYKRIRAVGATDGTLTAAVNQLTLETTPDSSDPSSLGLTAKTHEGQLIALKNLAEGLGTQTEQEATTHAPTRSAVPPGQEAGFRGVQGVRKIVILATNEFFDDPYGTDDYKDSVPMTSPHLNFAPTIRMLNDNDIHVIGMTAGVPDAIPDLQKIAGGTHTYAPPGGVNCGLTEGIPQILRAGEPLVCNNGDNFSNVIIRVLAGLVDRQNVHVVPRNRTPVLGALDGSGLLGLDVKRPNHAGFSVRVSCIDVKPGTYHQDVDAILRQTVVGKARLNVTCVKALTIVRPKPVALGNPPQPPAQPVVQPPAALPPPVPAAQPQVQPQTQLQTQVQVQPLTAGALQEQQELQLALAMNGTLKDDDPVFNAGQQMAMVDRRKREEVQALGVLAFAMTACAGLGLARLRTKPEVRVRRAR